MVATQSGPAKRNAIHVSSGIGKVEKGGGAKPPRRKAAKKVVVVLEAIIVDELQT